MKAEINKLIFEDKDIRRGGKEKKNGANSITVMFLSFVRLHSINVGFYIFDHRTRIIVLLNQSKTTNQNLIHYTRI